MSIGIQLPAYGDPHWKSPVSSESALPATGNREGDARLAMAENSLWAWQADAWVQISGGGGGGNAFTIMQTPAGTSPTADSPDSTLTFESSDSTITITGNSSTDTINFQGYKLPTQTGNNGKYLTTNGTTESWATVSGGLPTTGGTMTGNIVIDGAVDRWIGANSGNCATFFTDGTVGFYRGGALSGYFRSDGLLTFGIRVNNGTTTCATGTMPFEKSYTRQLALGSDEPLFDGYTNAQMHAMTPTPGTLIKEKTNNILCVYLAGSWWQLTMTAAP